MFRPGSTIVVAIGGNALVHEGEPPTIAVQSQNVERAMRALVPLVRERHHLVVTHGNGFQIGHILMRVAAAAGEAYDLPLDVCVAESQGEIGYLIERALQNVLLEAKLSMPVVSLLTQVVVDARDPAFARPTKPVGPPLSSRDAKRLEASGVAVARERGRGWRRLVASPRPLEIDDVDTIRWLLRRPTLVVAAGGGGVPVVRRRGGRLEGVPAVVDKDLASMVLARGISARHLVILTGVRAVYRDFATPRARAIRRLSIDEALALADAGHFPEGSMGPKIEAAIGFLREGGRSVTITDADHLAAALRGRDGTTLTRTGRAPKEADA